MSQSDFGTMDPVETSGSELAAILNAWRTALHSLHKGNDRPAYAVAGLLWIKDATDPWGLYVFDGAQDILIGSINTTTNVFTPSFGALTGILRADGSGGVAAATAAQIVAAIGALFVANADYATTAGSASTAGSAGTAAAIADGAVSSSAKVAANILTLSKLARTGTAGKPLLSGGAGLDFYVGDFPAAPVTSVGGETGDVTNAEILAAVVAALGYTPANGANYVGKDHGSGIGSFALGFPMSPGVHTAGVAYAGSAISVVADNGSYWAGGAIGSGTWRPTTTSSNGNGDTGVYQAAIYQRIT